MHACFAHSVALTFIALSQGVVLSLVSESGSRGPDDGAWVDMPIGPTVSLDIDLVNKELAEYDLGLIDPDEDEPEMVSPSILRVHCYSTVAI